MFQWFKRLIAPSPVVPPQLSVTPTPTWTLDKWSKSVSHVNWARSLFVTPAWQSAWSVLCDGIPRGFPVRGAVLTSEQAALELGRIQGYWDCLETLRALTRMAPKPTAEIPQDYLTPSMPQNGEGEVELSESPTDYYDLPEPRHTPTAKRQ